MLLIRDDLEIFTPILFALFDQIAGEGGVAIRKPHDCDDFAGAGKPEGERFVTDVDAHGGTEPFSTVFEETGARFLQFATIPDGGNIVIVGHHEVDQGEHCVDPIRSFFSIALKKAFGEITDRSGAAETLIPTLHHCARRGFNPVAGPTIRFIDAECFDDSRHRSNG